MLCDSLSLDSSSSLKKIFSFLFQASVIYPGDVVYYYWLAGIEGWKGIRGMTLVGAATFWNKLNW
jgi:hypothetical protein